MHKLPRSPFSTPLSGSAKEAEERIRNIFQYQKKRPPLLLFLAACALALSCGGLVSCESREEASAPSNLAAESTDSSTRSPEAQENIPADTSLAPVQDLTLPEGGQLFFTHRAAEADEDTYDGMVSSLVLHMPDGTEQEVAVLPYGPDHPYWGGVSLALFEDVMGLQGFTLSYSVGASWSAIDYYVMTEDARPSLAVSCTNTAWSTDLDGDGQTELLSGYGMVGYLDLFWRDGDVLYTCSLNETVRGFLGLSPDTWVSLQMMDWEKGSGLVTARWSSTESGRLAVPDRSQELSLGELFPLAQTNGEPSP